MTSNNPGPDDGRHLPEHRVRPEEQSPDRQQQAHEQQQYGHPYGRAPRLPGSGGSADSGTLLRTVYTFVIVWLTCAVIMWFGTRMLGFERGDLGAAVVSLVVSLAGAIAVTVWATRRGR
ncbi:hypothetical protein [Citricoccus alkalitolerans]|uniref:DUF2530 domain-containing protein n=1 Tax=Citricoccus alkalitolerans TaxID=246603 RepID=A0ABV8XVT0_9MICC